LFNINDIFVTSLMIESCMSVEFTSLKGIK